ncbi:MAG: tRNA pseudouridine(55) synthase TruB [Actinobacteria bacterium]|nr:MAG: tRNA pseudouridine(55) synthase TruB [Actinomycetota bacterium]
MISGFALIDKPAGWTSHDVVGRLRRLYGQRRVGHAGTLDPMATGVLVVGLGHATRLLRFVQGQPKTYEATIRIGEGTLTDDAEGETTSTPGWEWDPAGLSAAIQSLTGQIQQVPSAVSAVKVDGVRSYARVRSGQQVDLAARPVTINRFEMIGAPRVQRPTVDIDVVVDCSSGTYIRALARDLGERLGTAGHLTALRRTQIGGIGLEDCSALTQEAPPVVATEAVIADILAMLRPDPAGIDALRNGRRLMMQVPDDTYLVVDEAGTWVSVVTVEAGACHIEVNAPS